MAMMLCDCLFHAAITFQALAQCTACEDEQLKDYAKNMTVPANTHNVKSMKYQRLPSDPGISTSSSSKVKFTNDEITLIPCLAEILEETSKESLWYDRDNFSEFRASAIQEASMCMYKTGALNVRRAFTLLYQPESFMLTDIPSCE